jgi:hypothetical protein
VGATALGAVEGVVRAERADVEVRALLRVERGYIDCALGLRQEEEHVAVVLCPTVRVRGHVGRVSVCGDGYLRGRGGEGDVRPSGMLN